MSKSSDRVKKWRRSCKERIVEAMGGKCCVCGYNKCNAALALHHLDPSQKEISLGKVRANPQSWDIIVAELRKCVLVCHVCHSEIHENITKVPNDAPSFNEAFANYSKMNAVDILTPCPICLTLKPERNKTCSRACAAKIRYNIDWDSVDLVKELETKPVIKLAEELGCSDNAIHKRLRKMGLK